MLSEAALLLTASYTAWQSTKYKKEMSRCIPEQSENGIRRLSAIDSREVCHNSHSASKVDKEIKCCQGRAGCQVSILDRQAVSRRLTYSAAILNEESYLCMEKGNFFHVLHSGSEKEVRRVVSKSLHIVRRRKITAGLMSTVATGICVLIF